MGGVVSEPPSHPPSPPSLSHLCQTLPHSIHLLPHVLRLRPRLVPLHRHHLVTGAVVLHLTRRTSKGLAVPATSVCGSISILII